MDAKPQVLPASSSSYQRWDLNVSSAPDYVGFNATYAHHLSVATRAPSRSRVNKCDRLSATCCPFLLSLQGEKEKGRNLRCSPLQDILAASTCEIHTMELSWAELPRRVPLMPVTLKLTSNWLNAPQSSSSKQQETQEGNNSTNAEK